MSVSKIVDMKLLSLNIWCGKVYTPLMDYIKEQAKDTDIFCFQEVLDTPTDNTSTRNFRANIYEELGKILPNHVGYFSSEQEGVDPIGNVNFPITFGKAMFIRKSLDVKNVDDVFNIIQKALKNKNIKELLGGPIVHSGFKRLTD